MARSAFVRSLRAILAASAAAVISAPLVAMQQQQIVPRPVVIDGNNVMFGVPKAEPKLPSDDELAKVNVPAELVRIARTLDATSLSERAAARVALTERKPSPDELMALLLRRDLGDEARHQVVAVLRDRILHSPRGALGIRMENAQDKDGGVRIIGLVSGMPAEKLLKVGDVIRKVNDTPLRITADLVNSVQTLPPGVEVKLFVRRLRKDALAPVAPAGAADPAQPFEELELSLRLGSTEELNEKGDPAILGNGVAQIAGGANFVTYERVLAAAMAAKRFLPQPVQVEFQDRAREDEDKPVITLDSTRKLLMELQLADGDADLVRIFRARLDQLTEQWGRTTDPQTRMRLLRALEVLEGEIRSAF